MINGVDYDINPPRISLDRMKPHKKQQEIIEDDHRFKVVVFGRQSGKSWLAKRVLLDEAINKGARCLWLSSSRNNSTQHWEEMLNLLQKANFPYKKLRTVSKEIYFYGGGFIHVRTVGENDNLRGATVDFIVCDEAAFYAGGQDLWYRVIQPMITATGGRVMFTTTPNGWDWVYDLFKQGQQENNPYYKSWHMPTWESPYQDKALLEEIRKVTPELVWREEYGAEFIPDSGGVFANVLAQAKGDPIYRPVEHGEYVFGVDWGVDNDFTVITIVDKWRRSLVYGERFNSIGTEDQINRILAAYDVWRPTKIYAERNTVGAFMVRLLKERLADTTTDDDDRGLVVGIHLDNDIKRRLIERLAVDLEYGRLTLLKEDTDFGRILISEMSTFERQKTDKGINHTYGARRGYHDDTVMSLAFAYSGVPVYRKPRTPVDAEVSKVVRRSPFKNANRGR